MRLGRLGLGELMVLAGAICLAVSLFLPSYDGLLGKLDAWDTFGGGVILLIATITAGLGTVISALTERSTALPVATAVWCVPFALLGVIAAVVRLVERPDHATSLQAGAWLALAGAVLVLVGAWETLRDERPEMYERARPHPRARP